MMALENFAKYAKNPATSYYKKVNCSEFQTKNY